jgi:uncharacterized membrane protein YtjA (UPF0391 family)
MLRLALLFLTIAVVSAFLGFGGLTSYSWAGAKMWFYVFLALAIMAYIEGAFFPRRTMLK